MTTSNTTSFNLYRMEIISSALRKVGKAEPSAKDISYAADALNVIVKALDNEGIRLWKSSWYTKSYSSLSSEVTGTDGNIYTCILSHASSASNRPVSGAEWPIYWVLLGSTGGVWTTSTAYTSAGDFSVNSSVTNVEKMFVRFNSVDSEVDIVNRFGYAELFDKEQFGIPEMAWIDYSQSPPKAHLSRIPDDTDYVIRYLGVVPIHDFTYGSNTGDFPARWLKALIYMLANDIADEYLVGEGGIYKARALKSKADEYKRDAKDRDTETTTSSMVKPYF